MVQAGRRQAGESARLQAQRGNSHAGERRGYTSDSKATRPFFDHDDGNLHACGDREGEVGTCEHAPAGVGLGAGSSGSAPKDCLAD